MVDGEIRWLFSKLQVLSINCGRAYKLDVDLILARHGRRVGDGAQPWKPLPTLVQKLSLNGCLTSEADLQELELASREVS